MNRKTSFNEEGEKVYDLMEDVLTPDDPNAVLKTTTSRQIYLGVKRPEKKNGLNAPQLESSRKLES